MKHDRNELAQILSQLDLGSSVAEQDTLLQAARVETSVFTDLLNDRVDLIPGTKGSGKSVLYRIFVDFLPDYLLGERKVVIAHGVRAEGDDVFHAFKDQFEKLKEQDFINFWCIYLVSLLLMSSLSRKTNTRNTSEMLQKKLTPFGGLANWQKYQRSRRGNHCAKCWNGYCKPYLGQDRR
jgi:hypothetical protein